MSLILKALIILTLSLLCSSLKIAFLIPGNLSDFGYNYAIWQGVQEYQLANPAHQTAFTLNVSPNTCIATCMGYMNDGFDVIFFPSTPFVSCAQNLSITFPSKKFITQNTGVSYPTIPNLAAVTLAGVGEARFIVGVLAAKQKQTNKICLLIPKPYPFKERWANLILLGMRYAKSNDNLHVGLTLNFDDPPTDTKVANYLVDYGCDVIMQQAVNSITAQLVIANRSKWGMGWGSDMRDFVGESVLTSVTVDWSVTFSYFMRKIIAGTFTNELFVADLSNGGLTIADYSCEVTKSARKETNIAIKTILDGTMHPLCQPLIQDIFGTPCVNDSQIQTFYFPGITVFDGTVL